MRDERRVTLAIQLPQAAIARGRRHNRARMGGTTGVARWLRDGFMKKGKAIALKDAVQYGEDRSIREGIPYRQESMGL